MKKAAVICLLCLFTFQMVGVFLLFMLKQSHIRQEVKMQIKAGVPDSDLTILSFDNTSAAELKWIDDHEFVYQNQMFDVVKNLKTPEKTLYFCLRDFEETRLYAHLNQMVSNEMDKNQANAGNKIKIDLNWFFAEVHSPRIDMDLLSGSLFTSCNCIPLVRAEMPETPPPRYLCLNM